MASYSILITSVIIYAVLICLTCCQEMNYVNEAVAKENLKELLETSQHFSKAGGEYNHFKHQYPQLFDDKFNTKLRLKLNDSWANVSADCSRDVTNMLADVLQGKPYIFKVLDSIGKIPSGVSQGNLMWIGSYDVCTSIIEYKSNISRDIRFQGRHCLASIKGDYLSKVLPLPSDTTITVGVCVPNTCNAADLFFAVNLGIDLLFKELKVPGGASKKTLYSPGGSCSGPAEFKAGDTVACVLAGIIVLFVLSGSLYDIVRRVLANMEKSDKGKVLFLSPPETENNSTVHDKADLVPNEVNAHGSLQNPEDKTQYASSTPVSAAVKGFFHQFLMSFSAITNAEKLLTACTREGQLGAVNGIRVLSMWWVILGHTYAFVVTSGPLVSNIAILPEIIKRFSFQAVANATFSVDSFFFLSGLLVAYLLLRELKKSDGKVNWALLYFHRFWRLTPVYMFVLMMFSTLYLHIPTGPFMRASDGAFEQCKKYWWANLLYINNFVPKDLGKECMGWSWYLANDMQFFVISPAIIYLLYRFRYIGYSVVSALILGCLIVTGVVARINHVNTTMAHPANQPNSNVASEIYVYPQYRISPYLVGIATGYFIHIWENNGRPKIYKVAVLIGWCMAIAINMAVLYGVYHPNSTFIPWSDDVNALYVATSRFAWSLGLAWLTFACVTGYGGPVNTFLSWKVWAPLGRLTYCAYLVHPVVMFSYLLSRRQLIHYTDFNAIYLYLAHLLLSYIVAFVVSIAVEAPMLGLEKIIFKKKKD